MHRLRVEEAVNGRASVRSAHLVGRFFSSLLPIPVRASDREWVAAVLQPAELDLWSLLSLADRRESIAVARRTEAALAGTDHAGDTRWLAAALLHDIGKLDARFGPVRRALATLAAGVLGPRRVESWVDRSGFARRCALYMLHDQLGADRVKITGGRQEAAVWAGAHHRPGLWPETGIPTVVAVALAAADGERAR